MKFIPLSAFFVFFTYLLPAQTIHYVKHNATGVGNGTSWPNAFIRLQQALAVAQDGDEIWVAAGTYKPTNSNDRFVYYNLPSGVKVYGGFVGTENTLAQRDWAANPTILSGDIGVPGDSTDNSFNILYSYSPNEKTLLDGLIFEEGNATNTDPAVDSHRPTRSGGGVYLDGEHFGYAQLNVANCTFRHNRAQYLGGGLYANGREGGVAAVQLDNCIFENNVSKTWGGGMALENYFQQPYAFSAKNCVFKQNYAISGIALWLRAHQSVTLEGCSFENNITPWGRVVEFTQINENYPICFSRCFFENNGPFAVAYSPNLFLANEGSLKFVSCTFSKTGTPAVYADFNLTTKARVEFNQCVFDQNQLVGNSGGITSAVNLILTGAEDSTQFLNCLFYKNKSHELNLSVKNSVIQNCIFIDDPQDTQLALFHGASTYHVSNSLFRLPECEDLGPDWPVDNVILCDSTNLFAIDPLFVNPAQSDFHLQPCSPAINAGSNATLESLGINTDLEGNPRIRNSVVDMGPYEKHISLNPSQTSNPSCAGASDGAIKINPELCPPYELLWDNGDTTGTNLNGLAAGTYVFTAMGANNVPIQDTLIVEEPLPIEVTLHAHDVQCPGNSDGWIEASANGGTPPYFYTWDGVLTPFNLPPGNYFVTATDVNGCTGTAQATIGSPNPLQLFYTIQNASCMGCSDGSIVFDSVVGGVDPPLPASMFNLPAGVYCVSVTDNNACVSVVCITIEVSSGAQEQHIENLVKFSPNPTVSNASTFIEWSGNEPVTLRIYDSHGRLLTTDSLAPNTSKQLVATWPAGIYQIEILTVSGQRVVRRWLIG